jgi:hypothetical protein
MTFKQALNFLLELETGTVLLIIGIALLFFFLGLICIWVVAMIYSGLSIEQYWNILVS